jgi:hypothetical protein
MMLVVLGMATALALGLNSTSGQAAVVVVEDETVVTPSSFRTGRGTLDHPPQSAVHTAVDGVAAERATRLR